MNKPLYKICLLLVMLTIAGLSSAYAQDNALYKFNRSSNGGIFSKGERYTNVHNIESVVNQFRSTGIPLDVIVHDWPYWKGNFWCYKKFDAAKVYVLGRRIYNTYNPAVRLEKNVKVMAGLFGELRANTFALHHAIGIYKNQRKTGSSKRVLNLARASYQGMQRYGLPNGAKYKPALIADGKHDTALLTQYLVVNSTSTIDVRMLRDSGFSAMLTPQTN